MKTKYSIGDPVWVAICNITEAQATCPDCGGTARLRVIFHDEIVVSIPCVTCAPRYMDPTGYVTVSNRTERAELHNIAGIEVRSAGIVYRADHCIVPDDRAFTTEAEALVRAQELAVEADRDERKRIATKEKPTRTWAWHAAYHRGEIKAAKVRIEYHTAKLNAAALKTKAEKETL